MANNLVYSILLILFLSLIIYSELDDAHAFWNAPFEKDVIGITLFDNRNLTPERIEIVRDVVMSNATTGTVELEYIEDENRYDMIRFDTYYKGWYGAMQSISDLKFEFDIGKSYKNVLIILTEKSDPMKRAGYVTLGYSSSRDVTTYVIYIYDIDDISNSKLESVLRHELGHGHSKTPSDLMFSRYYEPAELYHDYISPCNIETLGKIYRTNTPNNDILC
jgi:predicted Zn-dependent protease